MRRSLALILIITAVVPNAAAAADQIDPAITAYLRANQRSLTVLAAGELRMTPSFSVTMSGQDHAFGSVRSTQATAGLALAYGVTRRTEAFADLPVGWLWTKETFLDDTARSQARTGIANVGVRHVLAFETASRPEVVGSLSFGYPVSDTRWAEPNVRAGVEAVTSLDPVMLFGGIGVSVGLDSRATQYDLTAGGNFAVSDRLALGAQVSWTSDGADFGDPLRNGVALTLSAGIHSKSHASIFQPYIAIGATEGAPDATLGLSWTRRW